ncbi:hypothetical protein RhiirC2_712486 [Rhizophagus irregularis]|uniref:Uncharacterized protein n=1 Tax=Rhizophagus irregularis TaxID=588596 RepID=A0A2N1N6X8_9GLOM|nr:hypothetical protein RhiirC2_712486 [Rhizophagus irregularis]
MTIFILVIVISVMYVGWSVGVWEGVRGCGSAGWECGSVRVWECGSVGVQVGSVEVGVWECESVGLCVCGLGVWESVVWECGLGVWVGSASGCGSVRVWCESVSWECRVYVGWECGWCGSAWVRVGSVGVGVWVGVRSAGWKCGSVGGCEECGWKWECGSVGWEWSCDAIISKFPIQSGRVKPVTRLETLKISYFFFTTPYDPLRSIIRNMTLILNIFT